MIKGNDLDNRGMTSTDPKGAEGARQEMKKNGRQAKSLAERLEAARALTPSQAAECHCGHCWANGRDAAIRAIEGEAEGTS